MSFLLADRPAMFPGRCLLGDTRGPCVDTGVEMELGGHVYLNRNEAWEVGRHFGFVEGETHSTVMAERDQAHADLDVAREQIAGLEGLVESLRQTIAFVLGETSDEPVPPIIETYSELALLNESASIKASVEEPLTEAPKPDAEVVPEAAQEAPQSPSAAMRPARPRRSAA